MIDLEQNAELDCYGEARHRFFRRLRLLFLSGQCAHSVFITWVSWDIADRSILIAYLIIHQLLVAISAYCYCSKRTNSVIHTDGVPKAAWAAGIVTLSFVGTILWLVPEVDVVLAMSTSAVQFACGTGTVVMLGPLKNFSRMALASFLLPHGIALLLTGHYSIGVGVFVFLAIVAIGAVHEFAKCFDELVALRVRSRHDAVELKNELENREAIEKERRELQEELLQASRLAGKAEMATRVLHNIGNVMNSVNVTSTGIREKVERDILSKTSRCISMLKENEDLPSFFANDKRAAHFIPFLEVLESQHQSVLNQIDELIEKVHHVNSVVSAQQSYASAYGCSEVADINDIVKSALHIVDESLTRHQILLTFEHSQLPTTAVERHRLIQILVNLLHNARNAIDDADPPTRKIIVSTSYSDERQSISVDVSDSGVGIEPAKLAKIFQHGFSGRKDKGGHGFGLHHSINSAKEVGWQLDAESKGANCGATFRIQIPVKAAAGVRV